MSVRPVLVALIAFAPAAATADIAATTSDYLREMDASGDGRVSLAEYQEYMLLGFRAMDRNRNEILDLDEFPDGTIGPNTTPVTLKSRQRNLKAAFGRQDRNRDGVLDAKELGEPPR